MNANYIRPIPKRMAKKILKCDEQNRLAGGVRFYAYLTTIQKELVKVTVAVRNKGKDERLIKQVAVHGVYSDNCLVRDIEYNYMGGFRVGWYDEGIKYPGNLRPYYNDSNWYTAPFKYYNPWTMVMNPKFAMSLPEFRYSAADIYQTKCIITYLRTYLKYPQAEYLVKAGLGKYVPSTMILKKVGEDKHFRKWMMQHRQELASKYYYIDVVMRAYKTGKPLGKLQTYKETKIKLSRSSEFTALRNLFSNKEMEHFIDYIADQNTNVNAYLDYLKACEYLKIDMSEAKNKFPHDFKRWHDMRIDQYATAKAQADEQERKALYEQFAAISQKYIPLEHKQRNTFMCIIAHSPADLIHEGEALHHCVGRMNYDRRFIREESLIFFVRATKTPDVPLVTIEYSLKTHRILQCYGEHNHAPGEEVLHYVNKVWLPYANKAIKKLTA